MRPAADGNQRQCVRALLRLADAGLSEVTGETDRLLSGSLVALAAGPSRASTLEFISGASLAGRIRLRHEIGRSVLSHAVNRRAEHGVPVVAIIRQV